jgi:hypothetical protein
MNKKLFVIIISVLGISLISIYGIKWAKRFFQIDTCLDRGGKWNYELNKCEGCYNFDSMIITDFYWHTDFDTVLNKEYIVKGKMLDSISKSPDELINILNRRKSKCKIEYIKMSGDTIKIKILDDEYLTEQMGTSGADCYLAETIFTLTENDLIKYVRIEMNEGSHASPGLYNRNDFNDLIKTKR